MNKKLLFVACLFVLAMSCQNQTAHNSIAQESQIVATQATQNFTYDIISGQNNTFGYDISVNGKKLIHQEHIPAMPGVLGFKTAEKAQKVAEFLIEKMKKGEDLPAISPAELNQLGVL